MHGLVCCSKFAAAVHLTTRCCTCHSDWRFCCLQVWRLLQQPPLLDAEQCLAVLVPVAQHVTEQKADDNMADRANCGWEKLAFGQGSGAHLGRWSEKYSMTVNMTVDTKRLVIPGRYNTCACMT